MRYLKFGYISILKNLLWTHIRGLYIVLYYGLYNIYTTNYRLYFMAYIYYILMMLLLIPKCQTD